MRAPYPLLFTPLYRESLWGGSKIIKKLGRNVSLNSVGESWEISDREEAMSRVENGEYQGWSLNQLLKAFPERVLGKRGKGLKRFPLLIKIIDAAENLSVQVHPSADRGGAESKSEAWYILESEPFSEIQLGFNRKVDAGSLQRAIEKNDLEDLLFFQPTEKGDLFFIPSGTVHSIGGGNLLLEVQQNSDTTYRLYDWNRLDTEGKKRTLHVDQALREIQYDSQAFISLRSLGKKTKDFPLLKTPFFHMEKIEAKGDFSLELDKESFHIFFNLKESFELAIGVKREVIGSTRTALVPARAGRVDFFPKSSALSFIHIFLAD